MDLIEKNLSAQLHTGRLRDILERNGTGVAIRYGYNSGGYENNAYFLTKDGAVLHIDTVIAEIAEVDFTDPSDPQWFLVGYDVNYDDTDLIDAHTGRAIPAAYA